ncbi:YgiW/YdeI family stress tolerance OB fold protein [Salinibius halmophilus]|uniref:YgiW/YdeI family stress tolerance OB fold protein n=1 Tax=Salinibius halmophilus TaxID=1853216 RepID=UPI000E66F3E4|nr:NirD/YgiW/YdeI family stress tolerance protein [Salinibius halmophilus]
MRIVLATTLALLLATPYSGAAFIGPTESGDSGTVAEVAETPLGTYVRLVGSLEAHLREDYYRFRDRTGSIRVEIEPDVWQGRDITPNTVIEITAEVDRSLQGRYLWVKSFVVVD